MPAYIAVGQKGTLRFIAEQAGLPQSEITSVSWQPQGSQQAVKFSPPDQVEGVAVGTSPYKASVTMKAAGEKYSFPFDVTCTAPAGTAPIMTPVAIDLAVPTPPTPPA